MDLTWGDAKITALDRIDWSQRVEASRSLGSLEQKKESEKFKFQYLSVIKSYIFIEFSKAENLSNVPIRR